MYRIPVYLWFCFLIAECTPVDYDNPCDEASPYFHNAQFKGADSLVFDFNNNVNGVTLENEGHIELSLHILDHSLVSYEGASLSRRLLPDSSDTATLNFQLVDTPYVVGNLDRDIQIITESLNHIDTLTIPVFNQCVSSSPRLLGREGGAPKGSELIVVLEGCRVANNITFPDNTWDEFLLKCVPGGSKIDFYDDPQGGGGAVGTLSVYRTVDRYALSDLDANFIEGYLSYEVEGSVSGEISRICFDTIKAHPEPIRSSTNPICKMDQ